MKPFIALFSALAVVSSSSATTVEDKNSAQAREKAKIVSRLYQATYGHSERCAKSSAEASQEFTAALSQFVEKNTYLMKLVTESEYYGPARARFPAKEDQSQFASSPEMRASECKYLASLLRSMTETEDGKAAVKEYEALLSK